jgi:hypothetical protein
MSLKDFVSDNNPTAIYHAARELGAPAYVKEANIIQPQDLAALAGVAFADPEERAFPIHTKAATWLSYVWAKGHECCSKITDSIKAAGEVHGITEDLQNIDTLFTAAKQASEPETARFALHVDFGGHAGMAKRAFYPIHDIGSVLGSSELMMKDAAENRLPVDYFYLAARELVKAAREFGLHDYEIHPKVLLAGEERIPDFETARWEAGRRKKAGLSDEQVGVYQELVAGAELEYKASADADRHQCMNKWASLWADLDAVNAVPHGDMLDPFQAFFSGTRVEDLDKQASQHVVIQDVLVPRMEFYTLTDNRIKAAFSKEAAELIFGVKAMLHGLSSHTLEGAKEASERLAGLSEEDQKELLRTLVNQHESATV